MSNSMMERLRAEREKMKQKSRGGGNGGFLKIPKTDEAEIRLRILPAVNYFLENGEVNPERDLFYKKFGVHWVYGKRIVCPQWTLGDDCPICKTVKDLYDTGNEDDAATAKEIRVKKRHWVNVVTVDDNGNYSPEPQIYEFGVKLLDNILQWCCDEEYYDLSDPVDGYDFKVIKRKVDGFPNYDASRPTKDASAIDPDFLKDVLDKAADIHRIIDDQVKSGEEIESMFDLSNPDSEEEAAEDIDQNELLDKINAKLEG